MALDRRDFLKAVGVGGASLALGQALSASETPARKRPNVILVITDDQGYGDLHCHGNAVIRTPALDGLHARSVRLTNFHVAPTCAPTRAGLMTGRYCNRTGVWHTIMGRSLLRRDEVTMADVFAAAGYRTGIFGKWHLGDNYPFRPQDRGFQEVFVHGGGGVGQTPDYWGNDYFDDTYFHNGRPVKCKGYCTDVWFDGALRFIEANKDRPFFAYLTTNAPHGPYLVAEKYRKPYRDKGVGARQAAFYGMITNIDENMARLLKRLDALGLAENTILIFLTDNGTSGGDRAGMRGQKGSEYEGGHRVPCFVRWPAGGLTGGRDVGRLTAHLDLLPTLVGLCRLKPPEGVKLDGASLASLLKGTAAPWPDRTLVVDSQRIEHPQKYRKSAVMTDRWRLVNGRQLFDVQADPAQKNDLAGKHPDVVERLRKAYDAWWADTSRRFDEYCRTVLGSDKENPVRITCHDWHGRAVPWNQGAVRRGPKANGFWAVEVARAGRYEFALRRWPAELNQPITAAIPGGKAIAAKTARLKVADVDVSKPIPDGAVAAAFQVDLKPGKTRLQTWLADEQGGSRGAYYVYVKRLS
jgi:arylsulfatase A-like enzyme